MFLKILLRDEHDKQPICHHTLYELMCASKLDQTLHICFIEKDSGCKK